ncbi:MAG: MptD family putative ECF transporter S component [Propionibacteriaceae bacterium]
MSTPPTKNSGNTVRFLVTVGAFTAIYIVVFFSLGMLGLAGPIFMLFGHALGILLNGVVIALYLAKTRRFGALTILGLAVGLLMCSTGHFWGVIIGVPFLGLCADLITRSGKYRSRLHDAIAYTVFSLWFMLPYLPIFYASGPYFDNIASQMGREYADAMSKIFTPVFLVIWGAAIGIVSFIAGWFGTKIVAKHFAKAGIA